MKKLAIITTHPIQYNAPFFRLLHTRNNLLVKVFYTWSQSEAGTKYDPGFGKNISWDIPLLEGYQYLFSENISATPGSHSYKGIDNPFLVKQILEWNADAVFVYGWNFRSHLRVMRFFHGKIPVLFRGDSTLLDEKPGLRKIVRRLYLRFIFSFVDLALYAGTANKEYFLAHGLKEQELIFMPHAVDNRHFEFAKETLDAANLLRAQFNIPKGALVFLFAGKLEEKKQPEMLCKVFTELACPHVYLIIGGSGILEKKLRTLYEGKQNFCFTGFVNQQQMPALYAACDVFVLPSKGPGETWGLSINEAMAAGKAIISSNACGSASDLIRTGSNGFIFDKNNPGELKEVLSYFIQHPVSKAKEMGAASEKIISDYSLQKDCEAIETAIGKISPPTNED